MPLSNNEEVELGIIIGTFHCAVCGTKDNLELDATHRTVLSVNECMLLEIDECVGIEIFFGIYDCELLGTKLVKNLVLMNICCLELKYVA